MLAPKKIKFNNMFIDELNMIDLIMDLALEGDNGETPSYLNRTAVQSESYDGRYKPTFRYKFDEVFAPKFTFLKSDYSDFSSEDVRKLLKYLTSTDTTSLLEVYYDDAGAPEFCCIGNWSEINLYKFANGRTIGVTAVFSSIHPFALSDLCTVTKTVSGSSNIVIDVDTDDNQPVRPRVTIQKNGSGVKFVNRHTDLLNRSNTYESIDLTNNDSGEIIVVDGANRLITSSKTNRIFGDDFNWSWLELYDGKNEITISGSCEVTLEYRCVRKLGEW